MKLTPWQRVKHRLMWGGSYTHPDGYIEMDFDGVAGINRDDSEWERDAKFRVYQRRQAIRERDGAHLFGAGLIGLGTYFLASHLSFERWDAIGVAASMAVGAYFLSR